MGRIITLSLAVLMTPVIVLSPEAEAQPTNLSQAQKEQPDVHQALEESAYAAAAGPEFCRRGPCPGFADVAALHRSMLSKAPKPASQAKTSGPFPDQAVGVRVRRKCPVALSAFVRF